MEVTIHVLGYLGTFRAVLQSVVMLFADPILSNNGSRWASAASVAWMEPALPAMEIPLTPSRAESGRVWRAALFPDFMALHSLDSASLHPC